MHNARAYQVATTRFTDATQITYETHDTAQKDSATVDAVQLSYPYGLAGAVSYYAPVDAGTGNSPWGTDFTVGTNTTGGCIDFIFGTSYIGNRTLRDVTLYVSPSTDGSRYYEIYIYYTTTSAPGNYVLLLDRTRPSGLLPSGYGTKIKVSQINIANIQTVRVWSNPYGGLATRFLEIDVNLQDCNYDSPADLNNDCRVDFSDLTYFADSWLISKT